MRTLEQINIIRKSIGNPYSISKFISIDDVNHLIEVFEKDTKKIKKNTGPVTLDLIPYSNDLIVKDIIDKIKKQIGEFEITAAFFFKTDYPHIIHNDDTYELPENVYKGITLPLKLEGNVSSYPKLCFFDQYYFHGPSKFFKGDSDIPTFYNRQVYDYSEVDGLTIETFCDKENLFTHLKSRWLEGLSLNCTLDWVPGSALIFDSVRLHCASDFRQQNIKSKLGISIFTKKLS